MELPENDQCVSLYHYSGPTKVRAPSGIYGFPSVSTVKITNQGSSSSSLLRKTSFYGENHSIQIGDTDYSHVTENISIGFNVPWTPERLEVLSNLPKEKSINPLMPSDGGNFSYIVNGKLYMQLHARKTLDSLCRHIKGLSIQYGNSCLGRIQLL